jgi:hypothetical protein
VAVLQAVLEVALVACPIDPAFDPIPMLLVIEPFPCVAGSILMQKYPISLRLIIHPIPLIDIPIGIDQPSMAIRHIIPPVPLIKRPIPPELLTPSRPDTVPPLPDIHVAVFELDCAPPLVVEGRFVGEWAQFLQGLLDGLVGEFRRGEVGGCGGWRGEELRVHQDEGGAVFAEGVLAGLAIAHLV